jgi:hypothetical protein
MNTNQFDNLTKRLVDRGGNRRTLLRLAAVLALPGLHAIGAPLARAAEVADAQCPSGIYQGYGRKRLAQTFKAQHTGRLTRVTIHAHSPDPTNTDDYLIEIRTTTRTGKPSKTVLASTQVNNIVRPPIGQTTEVSAIFTPGAKVKKGERYALVITGVGAAYPVLRSNKEAGCAGTLFDDNDLNNKFAKDTSTDIVFATFVTKA